MNAKDYILSGVLENYVLGQLSEKERGEVIDMMQLHPEVASYVYALENSLDAYGKLHAVAPPSDLKASIMKGISAQKMAKLENHPVSAPQMAASDGIQSDHGRSSIWTKLAIAAAILLLCSIGLNIYFSQKNDKNKLTIEDLSQKNQQLISDSISSGEHLAQARNQLALLTNPNIRPVTMKGVNTHPGISAQVYWNTKDQTVYLGKSDLPAVPQDKVYQLWAIIDGKPVDLGVFTPQSAIRLPLQMKDAQAGTVQAFAVTLEKTGGSPAPTMDQMYVMGPVS